MQAAPSLWNGEDANRDPCGPHQTRVHHQHKGEKPREQLVRGGAKDNLPLPGKYVLQRDVCAPKGCMCSKEQLQALLTDSPFIVLTQILTFALELEIRIIKPQISKHNGLVLVPGAWPSPRRDVVRNWFKQFCRKPGTNLYPRSSLSPPHTLSSIPWS